MYKKLCHKVTQESHEAVVEVEEPVGDERSHKWRKNKHRQVDYGLSKEVGENAVHLVGILSEEYWSFGLEDEKSVGEGSHEAVDRKEEEGALNLHGVVEELLLSHEWVLQVLVGKFAFKSTLIKEAYTIEDGAADQREEDLLTDFGSTLHRISFNTESVSAHEVGHLLTEASLGLFFVRKIWCG